MKDIKFVIFDVDGTLITKSSRILLDSTIDAIHQLQNKGIKVAIATGRAMYALEKSIIDRVHFDYYVCSNGTFIYDNDDKKIVYKRIVLNETINKYTDLCDKTNSEVLFQFEDAGYIYSGNGKLKKIITKYLGINDFIINHPERNHHLKNEASAIVSYIDENHLETFKDSFLDYDFVPFAQDYYDLNPKSINKATGIFKICDYLNIDYSQTMAFGDANNDYEMIEEAGIGIAMGNALDNIKEVAKYITEDTEHHGVHNALVHFGLIEGEKYV